MTEDSGAPAPSSFAARLDNLFKIAHPAGQPEASYQEVVDALAADGGPSISTTYLYMLRTGRRENPSIPLMQALAKYFNVPVAYFFDDDVAADLGGQLELLAALRDADVQRIALRSQGLSEDSRKTLADVIKQLRRADGLPDDG